MTGDAFVGTRRFMLKGAGPGDDVTISVWLKASNLVPDSAALYPTTWAVGFTYGFWKGVGNNDGFNNIAGYPIDMQFVLPSVTQFDWTEYFIDIPVPNDPEAVAMSVRLHPYARFTGTIYWDDLEFPVIGGVIPVELTAFTASTSNGKVTLNWSTATETNNFGFEIQKRYESTSFEKIGFVVGSGSTTVETHYSFTDVNNLVGRIYYRLKQIDFDGGFAFSNEIMVEIPRITDYQLSQNYPNPFNPSTTIKYSVPSQSKIKITLYDIIGNEVRTLFEGIQPSGVHEINLTADNLPSGVYFVSMTAENFNKTIKITLMN